MRTFARVLMCGLFATTLAFTAACGDDDENPTDTKSDATVADSAETTPDATVPDTTPDATVPDGTPDATVEETVPDATVPDGTADAETVAPTGSCANAADLAIIQSGDKDPSAKAAECGGTSCIAKLLSGTPTANDEFEACVQACMLNAALPNYEFVVSEACSTCYTKSVRCTAEFCGLNDPNKSCVPASFGGKGTDSADCTECRADNNCNTSFFTCSGLTPPP